MKNTLKNFEMADSVKVLSFSGIGRRKTNEDYTQNLVLPGKYGHLMVLCDGVGGMPGGEIASNLIGRQVAEYFELNAQREPICKQFIFNAIEFAKKHLDYFTMKYGYDHGISTTLALVCRCEDKAVAVWLGDSRIFHIREGKILWQSEDHNIYTKMVKDGYDMSIFRKEQVYNRLTKFIMSNYPLEEPEIVELDDLKEDDYILVVSDGVLEGIDTDGILTILSDNIDDSDKMRQIESQCAQYSHDNYSAMLYRH